MSIVDRDNINSTLSCSPGSNGKLSNLFLGRSCKLSEAWNQLKTKGVLSPGSSALYSMKKLISPKAPSSPLPTIQAIDDLSFEFKPHPLPNYLSRECIDLHDFHPSAEGIISDSHKRSNSLPQMGKMEHSYSHSMAYPLSDYPYRHRHSYPYYSPSYAASRYYRRAAEETETTSSISPSRSDASGTPTPTNYHEEFNLNNKIYKAGKQKHDKDSRYNHGRWKKEEHELFVKAFQICGRDWARIAREFVTTRRRSQVASHAQKYLKKLAAERNGTDVQSLNIDLYE
jgi:SHAQKYF class myb-like DNA-binding protein